MWITFLLPLIVTFLLTKQGIAKSREIDKWLVTHPASTRAPFTAIKPAGFVNKNKIYHPMSNSALRRCPQSCSDAGSNPANWTAYHDTRRLSMCNETMLLDFTIYNCLDDPNTQVTVYACKANFAQNASNTLPRRDESCLIRNDYRFTELALERGCLGLHGNDNTPDAVFALEQLNSYVISKQGDCGEVSAFAYSGGVAIGIHVGFKVENTSSIVEHFITEVRNNGTSDGVFVQHCAGNELNSNYAFGIVARSDGNLAEVQSMVKTWRDGGCFTSYSETNTWENFTISLSAQISVNNYTSFSNISTAPKDRRPLHQQNVCATVVVASGDDCGTLALECGISQADFTTYNPSSTLCSSLAIRQHVCCSAGDLPDNSPKSSANGTYATYIVTTNDSCSQLAAIYSITNDEIESFNKNTWGWMGCADLQAGSNICLSKGYPPMPAIVANAICGPQVPGTTKSHSELNLSIYNQCKMNACCDVWGQCGTTSEFCTQTQSLTGAPGTAAPGTNGCISNCGTGITISDPPRKLKKVGYWEGYNFDRPCLNKRITDIDNQAEYTHIHLAFATITTDFEVDISPIQQAFSEFLGMSGFKRILSFGGWEFSTSSATYQIFRDAMAPANSSKLSENIAAFVRKHGLDGVDLDRQYPGTPDLPGIPAGSLIDGINYLALFQELKTLLAAEITLSVTAPTSYGYLAPFMIFESSAVVDYIVYMTHDFHGQWDFGSKFSDFGCPAGDCLRSGVNLTEALWLLSMITKAGVPSNKIVVGLTSYGRSFQTTTPGCFSASCTYTGPASGAYAGACTQRVGYMADAEINSIIAGNATVLSIDGSSIEVTGTPFVYLDDSYSNIVVYNDDQWISYMDSANKLARTALFASYNFGGTADWAIDLQSYDENDGSGSDGSSVVYISPSICMCDGTSGIGDNLSITCELPCIFVLPPFPLETITTITWPLLTTTFLFSSTGELQTVTSTISVSPFTISEVDFQPITLHATHSSTYTIFPMQSIMPSSFVYTLPAFQETFSPTAIPTADGFGGNLHGGLTSKSTAGSSSNSSNALPAGVWFSTPYLVTIQPMPTHSIVIPLLTKPIPSITISSGKPESTKSAEGDGTRDCKIFGCKPHCGLFACHGGCRIFGCSGGCGPLGCVGDCPLVKCGGLGCVTGCGSSGSENDGNDNDSDNENENNDDDCDDPVAV